MRHLFICTLLCILPIPALAQTTRSLPRPRQAKGSDLSRNSALALEWANRVMANDPKVRANAEAALVQGAGRSLPLLRRFLNLGNEDLEPKTFEIIRRIGPPAIPLLADLLRDERVSIQRGAVDALIDLSYAHLLVAGGGTIVVGAHAYFAYNNDNGEAAFDFAGPNFRITNPNMTFTPKDIIIT